MTSYFHWRKAASGLDIEENYPKQVYDVDALIQTCDISQHFIDDFVKAIDCLVTIEASYRQIDVERQKVLKDIISTMQNHSLVDMPSGDNKLKRDIDSFQQFYVNGSQRKSKDDWSTKALRIKFLALLASLLLEQKIGKKDAVQLITRCRAAEQALSEISGGNIPKIRSKVLALQTEKMKDFTVLKGKSLQRVFWQVLTPERLTVLNL